MPKRSRTEANPEYPAAAFVDLEAVESSEEDDEEFLTDIEGKYNRSTCRACTDLNNRQLYRSLR